MSFIAATVAIAAVSAIAQAYTQAKAQKASKDELNRIKKAYDAIVPPEFDTPIDSPPELIAETAKLVDYDFTKMTPEEFEVVGQYSPEIVPYIAEQKPELVKDTAAGREGLQAQQQALQRLQQIAGGGIDPQFAQRMAEADKASQIAAQSRQESVLQDYARRGLLGSGTQLAAQLSGAEGAMERGAQMSSDAATQAYLNQLGALRDSANLGGQIRGQELDLADRNAAIANAFNQRTTAAYQNYLQNAANARNEAALKNLAAEQGVSNLNVEERNRSRLRERERSDLLKEKLREQSIANTAAENQIKRQGWMDKLEKQRIEDARKQQTFGNTMAKTSGQAGVAGSMSDSILRGGQQTSQQIQGVQEGLQSGIGYYDKLQQREEDRRDRDRREELYDRLIP